jgi:hypothetical protein
MSPPRKACPELVEGRASGPIHIGLDFCPSASSGQARGKLFAGMTGVRRFPRELSWACGPPNWMKVPILVAPAKAGAHVRWIPTLRQAQGKLCAGMTSAG